MDWIANGTTNPWVGSVPVWWKIISVHQSIVHYYYYHHRHSNLSPTNPCHNPCTGFGIKYSGFKDKSMGHRSRRGGEIMKGNGEKGSRKNFLQNDVKVFKLFLSTTSSEFVLLLANPNEPTHNPSIDGWELQSQLNCGAASIFRINELNDNSCVWHPNPSFARCPISINLHIYKHPHKYPLSIDWMNGWMCCLLACLPLDMEIGANWRSLLHKFVNFRLPF